jgi:hypothetical protein
MNGKKHGAYVFSLGDCSNGKTDFSGVFLCQISKM